MSVSSVNQAKNPPHDCCKVFIVLFGSIDQLRRLFTVLLVSVDQLIIELISSIGFL